MNRKFATFRISRQDIVDKQEEIEEIFSILRFVPVRAEALFAEDVIEYTGLSNAFVEVGKDCEIPEVELIYDSEMKTVEVKYD